MGLTYEQQEPIWDARKGIVHHGDVTFYECVRRLHRALPTTHHAERLVEAILAELGDRGRPDPYSDGRKTMVLRADPRGWWMRRSPAAYYEGADFNECDVASEVPMNARPADAPVGWTFGTPFRPTDPKPDILPDGLGKAVLTLLTGDAMLEIKYDQQGLAWPERVVCRFGDRWGERRYDGVWPPSVDPSARPPQPPPPAWFVDFPEGIEVEEFAERIVSTDPALDPVRVRMNVDAPGGVEGRWWQSKMSLRKLAMTERLPTEGGVLVLDAYEHDPELTCLALGRNLGEAEAAWLVEERRVRPRFSPETPQPHLPEDEDDLEVLGPTETETIDDEGKKRVVVSTGLVHLIAHPVREIPWPIPGPQTTPAVAIRIPPMPAEVPPAWRAEGFSRWRYLIGDSGQIGFALIRDEEDGFTQVGDGLLDVVEPRGLERAMMKAVDEEDRFPWPEPPWLRYPYEHRHFIAWDNMRQTRKPLTAAGGSWGLEWNWRDMEGDIYRWRVTRMRYIGK